MLGDITPQSIKIDQQAVVYPGRDHVSTLVIKRFDGRSYKTVDTSALTRVVLAFPGTDPVIAYDSDTTPAVFSWSGSAITIDLSDYSMPASIQPCYLIAYDAEHPNGQVLVDNNDSVLAFDFRNISAAGILQPPVIELISEAPIDGVLYGRRDAAWVAIDDVVAGVSSVNGLMGTVVLYTDDIDEGAVNLYHTPARAAAAAPVQTVNDQTGTVVLDAADVGADPSGTAAAAVGAHEEALDPHPQYQTESETDARYEFPLVAGTNITIDRTDPLAPVISAAGGGASGAVDSVNGQTGVVVLDAEDVGADPEGAAQDARFTSTGLISGGALSINSGDNTKLDIAAGVAVFADYTDPVASVATVLPFGPFVATTVTSIAAANASYIGIDSTGTIIQQINPFSNTQRRSIVSLGVAIHSNNENLNTTNTVVAPQRQLLNQFGDGLRALGQLNLSGNVYSPNGANLQINKSAGELFAPGSNYHVNPDDPHAATIAVNTPVTFRYRLQNGTEYINTTSVDPANYDNAGTLTAIPGTRFSFQLIALFQTGITRIQYGQDHYPNLATALAAAQAQTMVLEQNIAQNGVVRGYIVLRNNTTALNNTTTTQFITLSKFNASAAVSPLAVSTTDELAEGATNLYFTPARVRIALLTGVSFAVNAAIAATDTVLEAFGKLQAQIAGHFGVGGNTHPDATTSVSGFMSGGDKTKLNGIATSANNYTHPNHSGDVTSAGDGAQTIANNAVTNAKASDMAVNTIKGRVTAGTGDPEDLTATQARTLLNVANGATALAAVATFTGNKTLALTDVNTYNVSQDGTAQTVTLPAQATVTWTADAEIHIEQGGSGVVTVTGATGVTINGVSAGSFVLAGQFSAATLKRKGSDSWTLVFGAFAYNRGNILGTVSQSSGVPTGAIIERGANANGEYVRYADGTQLCWTRKLTNVFVDAGTSYTINDPPPAAFVGQHTTFFLGELYTGTNGTGTILYGVPLTGGAARHLFNQGTSPASVHFSFANGTLSANSVLYEVFWTGRWF
jgi:hypothetical protein